LGPRNLEEVFDGAVEEGVPMSMTTSTLGELYPLCRSKRRCYSWTSTLRTATTCAPWRCAAKAAAAEAGPCRRAHRQDTAAPLTTTLTAPRREEGERREKNGGMRIRMAACRWGKPVLKERMQKE
jgi:hypothetical protein